MNKEIILRLSKYKRLLQKLKALGLERVFSNNLGDALGVTPALVRKDFSFLKITGNKRGGYSIDELIQEIDDVLGKNHPLDIIVAGCGKIGIALMKYKGLINDGITVAAGFDINPEKVNYKGDIPIYPMEQIESFIKEKNIKVGVIAVPERAATEVYEIMLNAGIKGFLNFSPVDLKCARATDGEERTDCIINNINLAAELENLFYHVNKNNTENK